MPREQAEGGKGVGLVFSCEVKRAVSAGVRKQAQNGQLGWCCGCGFGLDPGLGRVGGSGHICYGNPIHVPQDFFFPIFECLRFVQSISSVGFPPP